MQEISHSYLQFRIFLLHLRCQTQVLPCQFTFMGTTTHGNETPTVTSELFPKESKPHRWRSKEVPSGFFRLPGAENVSAVLFNASGTLSKFNRMGVLAHFGSRRVILTRHGFSVNVDPNSASPNVFRHVVNSPNYRESWVEGMNVFHNPNAKHAISPEMIPGAAHHMLLDDGQIESLTPDFQPFGSWTQIHVVESEAEVDRFLRDRNQDETGSV